jgi:hypothetical protein
MRVVAVLAYNRPDYLEKCLEALSECRGAEEWGVLVSVDGPCGQQPMPSFKVPKNLSVEVARHQANQGIDRHNALCASGVFDNLEKADFMVMLEDDALLTPDALELAYGYYSWPRRDDYLFMSIGDPKYAKGPATDEEYAQLVEERYGIYTSAWCFTKDSWTKMRSVWNHPMRTQLGWDWSLSTSMHSNGWKSIYPVVSRARNIGRVGVHAYAEWFDQNVAPARCSDGRPISEVKVKRLDEREPLPEWLRAELAAGTAKESGCS